MTDVMAAGELLVDFSTVTTDQDGYPTLEAHPGGAPANYLATLRKFGAKAAMVAKVGQDTFGSLLISTLQQAGIDTRYVFRDEQAFTTLAFVTLDAAGDRAFSFARKPGADTRLKKEEIPTDLLAQTKVLHFGTLSMTDEPARTAIRFAVEYARSQGVLISFDPNLRPPLWKNLSEARTAMRWGMKHADFVKMSEEEAEFLTGETPDLTKAEALRRRYHLGVLFVTQGKNGCLYASDAGAGHIDALPVKKVVDTTGAGDIFGGAAMWAFLQKKKPLEALTREDLEEIGQFACTAAGLSTRKRGGISSIPSLAEIQQEQKRLDRPRFPG